MAKTPQKTLAEQVAALSEDLARFGRKRIEGRDRGCTQVHEHHTRGGSRAQRRAAIRVEQPFDRSQYKTVIDAAMDLTDKLVTTYTQFLRSIAESASQTVSKKE